MEENNNIKGSYAQQGAMIGNAVGDIVALVYAFKIKSGFWKGLGLVLLGGLSGGGLGYGIGSVIKKNN